LSGVCIASQQSNTAFRDGIGSVTPSSSWWSRTCARRSYGWALMDFLFFSSFFSLFLPRISCQPLKKKCVLSFHICINFDPHCFNYYLFYFWCFLKFFFFNSIPRYFISFNFCIQFGSHSFYCYFSILFLIFF